jgi:hypothetical protein
MSTRVRSLSPHVVVDVVDPGTSIARDVLDRIETVWSEARARRPQLFDGELFACDELYDEQGVVVRLAGHFVPYRWYVAARADPEIASSLQLRALGVSALLRCRGGIVVGRRAATTNEGGLLELVPSGAVDADAVSGQRVDLRAAVLAELEEELGLSERDLDTAPSPFVFVEDDAALLLEAGFRMSTPLPFEKIQAKQQALPTREHDELQVLSSNSWPVIDEPGFSTTSAALIRAAGLA